jgi:predicted nucleic acid-binding protein
VNGNSIFIDTNIILYLLNGDDTISELLQGKDIYVSVISELELLGYKGIEEQEVTIIEDFFSHCIIVDLNQSIKKLTIGLKRKHRIKLPDAIIAASAQYVNIPLLSADKGFEKLKGLQFVLYELS